MDEDTEVWQHVFQELIQEVKPWHTWTLTPDKDLSPNVLKQGWTQYQQKAFARFHCPTCCRSWASGRVLVVFHMHWCEKKGKGHVKMRAFAQRCSRCPEPPFAAPEFTWDNISRILNNLIFRILKKCYKEEFKQMDNVPLLGDTSLEGPHDSNNCEACLQGFCAQSGLGPTSKPPAPLLSPTSKSTREAKVTATCSNMPSSQPSSKVERLQASEGNPKASHPTKDDPKVSHTSRPSTVPIVTTQPLSLSLVSSPTPRYVTDTPYSTKSSRAAEVAKNHPRSKALPHSSSFAPPPSSSFAPPPSYSFVSPPSSSFVPPTSSYVLSSSNVKKPQVSAVNPKASHPTKDDPKVSHTCRPSTVPIVTSQPLLLVSSPTPKNVTDMPYPIKSSRAAEVAKKKPRSKALPHSSSFAPLPSSSFAPPPSSLALPTSFSYAGHSSWRSPANTTCQVEISSHSHPQSESFCCKACCEGCCKCCGDCCEGCCKCFGLACQCCFECCKEFCNCMSESPCCRRFVFLIFVAIVVILVIQYGL